MASALDSNSRGQENGRRGGYHHRISQPNYSSRPSRTRCSTSIPVNLPSSCEQVTTQSDPLALLIVNKKRGAIDDGEDTRQSEAMRPGSAAPDSGRRVRRDLCPVTGNVHE